MITYLKDSNEFSREKSSLTKNLVSNIKATLNTIESMSLYAMKRVNKSKVCKIYG